MLKKTLLTFMLVFALEANATETGDVVCSYAPSQSKVVSTISGAGTGAGASLLAIAQVTGLTVVTHSSGAAILTGSGGYIAGTLGAAAAGPFIVAVGLVAGGVATTVELVCAPKNHPDAVDKVIAASQEFSKRIKNYVGQAKNKVIPNITQATTKVKQVAGDVLEYAYSLAP